MSEARGEGNSLGDMKNIGEVRSEGNSSSGIYIERESVGEEEVWCKIYRRCGQREKIR